MELHDRLAQATGFEWDAGNLEKSRLAHGVTAAESEQVFFNEPLVLADDPRHSGEEDRFYALGRTASGRILLVVFTMRGTLIRVISARDASRREARGVRSRGGGRMSDRIPAFSSEDEERAFWAEHDSADYVDWSKASRVVLPNLKPSTRSISLRLPEHMLAEIKVLANQHDVPYQSLIKLFLAERLSAERWKRSKPVRLKEEGQRYPTRDEMHER